MRFMLDKVLRPRILLLVALAGTVACVLAPRLLPSAPPPAAAIDGFRPEDIIGWHEGEPIVLAGTRSVFSIFEPKFVAPGSPRFGRDPAATYADDEPVIGISSGGIAKAYSTWFLNARELVHDTLGEKSLLVTW